MKLMTYSIGPRPNTVQSPDGIVLDVPSDWTLVPPGDAALTRRIKTTTEHWMVSEKKGRRTFSKGVYADGKVVAKIQSDLSAERSTDQYAKRKLADAQRREKVQGEYVEQFQQAIIDWLAFAPSYKHLADKLSAAVAAHATPVGSGTVARTKMIPIQRRAQAAVIAWMRHQTTGYDGMVIPRVKGKRREVRRMLAARSQELLQLYRDGQNAAPTCPLQLALDK